MDVWECALGFMDSQMLLTAEELGLFNILERPLTAKEVSHKAGLPLNSTERLLNGLCTLNLIETENGCYRNTPHASKQLVRDKPGYVGDMFDHMRNELYPLWGHLKTTLREERRQSHILKNEVGSSRGKNDASLGKFFAGMYKITYESANEFAGQLKGFEDVITIVDVGGASGAFLISLAEHFPAVTGTVADLEYVKPFAEEYFRKHNLNGRLKFKAADFFSDQLPENADAYILSFILHDWDTDSGSAILYNISQAAKPGSKLLLSEYFLNEDKTGEKHIVRSDLNMLVAARGKERTASEYINWIKEFGFETEYQLMDHNTRGLIVARKV